MNQDQKTFLSFLGIFLFGLFLFAAVILVINGFFTIDAGERGVLLTFGEADPLPRDQGFHFKIPFIQSVVTFDVKTQKYETQASSASKDLQIVTTRVALNYKVFSESVVKLYSDIGVDYRSRIIEPVLQEAVKSATAQFNAEQLITQRPLVKQRILEVLRNQFEGRYIDVEDISITDFSFSQSFDDAIEAKVRAEQEALRAENELRRIEIEKQQTITRAEATADSTKLQADAEAYALRVVRQELEQANNLVEYRAVEKWDGVLPKFTGEVTPFIDASLAVED